MKMTIEEQIRGLEYLKKCGILPFSDTRRGIVITDEYVDEAIYTMRKYQKIAEICDKFATDVTYLQEMAFYDIKDVVRR